MTTCVRSEQSGDHDDVRRVNEEAFGRADEARLVESLRGSNDVISLVATIDDRVVGQVLFTPVRIEPARDVRVSGLGPIAVLPAFQRRGVGGDLIRRGLEQCRGRGYAAVFVLGHPDYYPRFGFVPAQMKGLEYEALVPPEIFMVIELEENALSDHKGIVHYLPEFAGV